MKTPVVIFFLICWTNLAMSQSFITGQVIDSEKKTPLEFTTVSLLNPADSALVSGSMTDTEGNFQIAADPGRYIIKVQYVSYEPQEIGPFQLEGNKSMGKISLLPTTETLSEVIVQGQRDQAVLELDRRVFNVGENVANAGRNASELLDNLPSVSVDTEGNVSLRGSGNVRVLIDGKPSGMIGIGDTEGLQNLSGDMIERVEIITNPSSRYDAQGSGGIINIVLKKKRNTGLNGSFTLNAGEPANYGGAINLNYGREKVNFFLNYSSFYRKSPGMGRSSIYRGDTITLQDQQRIRSGLSHNLRFGTDFMLSETSTLTASVLYNVSDGNNTSDLYYNNYNLANQLMSRTLRVEEEREDEQNQEYELSYRKTFSDKGNELVATAQFRSSAELENSNLTNYAGINEQTLAGVQRSFNDETEDQWLLQADYTHPVFENGKIEIGTRNTLRKIGNDYLVEEQAENGIWNPIDDFTNNFRYDENVYAAYAMFNNKTGNWTYQAGLRAEATDITIGLLRTNEQTDKNYLNLFPSAALTYNLQEGKSIQGSYSRRVNRPNFRALNPFSSYSDTLNLRIGNPDLDPEYTDSYELGYLHNFAIGNVYAGGYYRHTTGVEQRISRQIDGIIFTRPENLGTQNSFGIEFNTNLDLASWWNINGNFNFFRAITEGESEGIRYTADTYTMLSRINSKWKIDKLFNVQFNAFYMAPEQTPQGRRKAMYAFDLGLTRDVLKKKGTLMLNAQDLLNTRKFRFTTVGESFTQDSEFQWRRGPQVTLTFTYRLNQFANANSRDRGQGGRDENNGGGGGMEEGQF